tara:strand:+ start:2273 stop:4690 length:2418 start_codon:yes stop_codon:yes gene_type:complete
MNFYPNNFQKSILRSMLGLFVLTGHTFVYGQLEEVIVTAQKRSESLQDVPVAVSAFTADQMKTLGVTDASKLVDVTPGFSSGAQQGSNRSYFLRGVGTNDVHLTASSAVGQYFDGITLTSGYHARAALYDMERVEVLKGPQNTLFGLNTTGGAVNYISNKPEIGAGTQGSASVNWGSNSHLETEFAVGFDISDKVAARFAMQTIDDDGAFTSISNGKKYGDDDVKSARLSLLWEPSDQAAVTFNMHALESQNNSTAVKAVGTRSADGSGGVCADAPMGVVDFEANTNCLGRNGGATGEAASDPSTDDWKLTAQDVGLEDISTEGFYLKVDYDLGWATLNSITSMDNLTFKNANDNDGSDTLNLHTFQQDDRDTFQQEIRLISNGDEAYRWIAGVYFLDEEADSYTGLRGSAGKFGAGNKIPSVELDHTKENFGIYFQSEYDISDTLTLTAGLRYSDEEIVGNYRPSSPIVAGAETHTLYFSDDVAALVAEQNPGTAEYDANGYEIARQIKQTLGNNDVGYTVKLDWKATEDSMIYASVSKGFKGSALDTRPVYALFPVNNVINSLEDTKLAPESLDVWELGYKGMFWDDRIELDASTFLYTYENLQQFVSAAGGLPRLENAPESEITGFDANVRYANDGGFYLQAGVSMLDTEVTKSGDSSFIEGAELAMAPEVSFNLLASQDVQLQSGNMLNLTANISHTGDQVKSTAVNGNANVVDQLTQEAYTLVNANLSYRFGNADQYALSLYGRNLTDEHYCGHILINDGNAILAGPNPKSGKKDTNQSVLCRVTNASTRTFGASISIDF